jgi:hypothetical protein
LIRIARVVRQAGQSLDARRTSHGRLSRSFCRHGCLEVAPRGGAGRGRTDGEVRFPGEIEAGDTAVTKLVRRLSAKHGALSLCYEAGPTG